MDLFTGEVELFESAFLSAFAQPDRQREDGDEIASPGPSTSSNDTNELVTISNEDHHQLDVILHDLEPMRSDESLFPSEETTQFLDPIPTNHSQQGSCAYEQSILGYSDSGNVYQQAQDWTQLTSCAYQQTDNGVLTSNTGFQEDAVSHAYNICRYSDATPQPVHQTLQDSFGSDHTYNSCRSSQSTSPPLTFHIQYPDSSNAKKRKRVRTAFTTSQLLELEDLYRRNNYLDRLSRLRLAERMQLHEKVIKVWFQNRRMKEKKQESGEA